MRKFRWIQYDLSLFLSGSPIKNATLGSFIVSRQMMVPPLAPDSVCFAGKEGTSGDFTMYLKLFSAGDNYVTANTVGTIYFAQNTKQGVLTINQGINFLQGDMLQVTTDNVQQVPTNLGDISLTILGFSVLRT